MWSPCLYSPSPGCLQVQGNFGVRKKEVLLWGRRSLLLQPHLMVLAQATWRPSIWLVVTSAEWTNGCWWWSWSLLGCSPWAFLASTCPFSNVFWVPAWCQTHLKNETRRYPQGTPYSKSPRRLGWRSRSESLFCNCCFGEYRQTCDLPKPQFLHL